MIPVRINSIQKKDLPKGPAVYIFSSQDKSLYVGRTDNLRRRFIAHTNGQEDFSTIKKRIMEYRGYSKIEAENYMKNNFFMKYMTIRSEDIFGMEHFLIAMLKPLFNDGKRFKPKLRKKGFTTADLF